jgi:hypothetical protein
MANEYGPFRNEREALATRAGAQVQFAYDAYPDDRNASSQARLRLLTGTCKDLGVDLGDYDLRLFDWLSQWETGQCVALAGIIRRAAGRAAEESEWGVRFTIGGVNERPLSSEEDARTVVANMRVNRPEFDAVLIVRVPEVPAGPWRLADGEICRHCGGELVRCDPPHDFPVCKGWKHAAWLSMGPVGPHYCEGRSVNPSGEPREDGDHG